MEELGKEFAKGAGQVIPEVYKDALQPGLKPLGNTLGVLMEWVFQKTNSIRLGNYEAELNYQRNKRLVEAKIADIPPEKFIDIPPEMGVPLLERLSYTSNEQIADMFGNLLAQASNADTAKFAHPAFVQMIERLSVDEAKIINHLKGKKELLYAHIRAGENPSTAFVDVLKYLTELSELPLDFPENLRSYLGNFIGMGLLMDRAPDLKTDKSLYNKIKQLHQKEFTGYQEGYQKVKPDYKVDWKLSFFEITPFGQLFINSCTGYTKLTLTVTAYKKE